MTAEPQEEMPALDHITGVEQIEVRAAIFGDDNILPALVLMRLDGLTLAGPVKRFYALRVEDAAELAALLIAAGCRINPADFKGHMAKWAEKLGDPREAS